MKIVRDTRLKKCLVFLTLLLYIACSTEELPVGPIVNPDPNEDQSVLITITFPGAEAIKTKSPTTYSISTTDENSVTSLDIFAFTSGGGNVSSMQDIYAYRVSVPSSDIVDVANNGQTKKVTARLKGMDKKQRFIFIANMPSSVSQSLILTEGVTTQEDIVNQLKFKGSSWHPISGEYNTHIPFPMWGMKKDSMLINATTINSFGTIDLIRSLARVDVGVAEGLNNFKLQNVYIYNASDSGFIAPHQDQLTEKIITKTNTAATRITHNLEYKFPATGDLNSTIYIPESDSLIINGSDSIKPAYLVLHAKYNNEDNYYRIDFTKDNRFHPILRNHNYKIKIIGAKEGYKNIGDARDAAISNLNFSLTLENDQSDINEVVYNDQYMLGVNVSEVLFDWDQSKPLGRTSYFPLNIFTNYANGWSAEITNGGGFISIDGVKSGSAESSDSIKIVMKEDNKTGVERKGSIRITAGMLTKDITIRQSGGANSHMIRFGSGSSASVNIPLAFAGAARNSLSLGSIPTNDLEAKVLWQEYGDGQVVFDASLQGGSTGHITVTARSTGVKYGNAVIALIKKGSGIPIVGGIDEDRVLWSWHVWSMPAGDDDMDRDFHNPNKPVFMQNVMGKNQYNKGLFYQWGRKDPFPDTTDIVIPSIAIIKAPVPTGNNIDTVVLNPTTFYYNNSLLTNWIDGNNDNFWVNSKTYHDPCPTGWRVPSENEVASKWTSTTFSVINGNLLGSNGAWKNASNGYIWVTGNAGTGSKGRVSVTSSNATTPATLVNKTEGNSIRCIKDITLIKTQ